MFSYSEDQNEGKKSLKQVRGGNGICNTELAALAGTTLTVC